MIIFTDDKPPEHYDSFQLDCGIWVTRTKTPQEEMELINLFNGNNINKLILTKKDGIIELPSKLTVRGDMNISGTDISSLPNDLSVYGWTLTFGTNIPKGYVKPEGVHNLFHDYILEERALHTPRV